MQVVVIDEKGGTIEAAIVKIIKAQKSEDEPDNETVTYARVDENGRFLIKDLDQDEEYIIEIHLEKPESEIKTINSADENKEENIITDTVSIDNTTENFGDITDNIDNQSENNQNEVIENIITMEEKAVKKNIKIVISDVNEGNQYLGDYLKPNHDLRNKLYQIRNNTWW